MPNCRDTRFVRPKIHLEIESWHRDAPALRGLSFTRRQENRLVKSNSVPGDEHQREIGKAPDESSVALRLAAADFGTARPSFSQSLSGFTTMSLTCTNALAGVSINRRANDLRNADHSCRNTELSICRSWTKTNLQIEP
jgi:hypothetical protein